MRLRFPRLFLVVLLVCLAGCESRDRINPFDPGNPDTGGVPALVDARAGNGRVDLAWELDEFEGIGSLHIQRRYREDVIKDLVPSGLAPTTEVWIDTTSQNDVRYEYRLELELLSGAHQRTEWDAATPGDAVPWVADSDGGGLSRLTPDGRDRVHRIGAGRWFLDLAVDTLDRAIWSVDYLEGTLFQHSLEGNQRLRVAVPGARAVDVDLDGSSVWVGSFDLRMLERRLRDGRLAWADSAAGYVEDLLAVVPRGVWMCNREGEVRIYRDDQVLNSFAGLDHPVALAASRDNMVLLLERGAGRVRLFDSSGVPIRTGLSILSDPIDLCRDGEGGAWVADPGRGGLVHLNDRLEEVGFAPFEGVLGVTWDEQDGRLWAAGGGRVELRDAAGAFVSGSDHGPRPIKVEVWHGTLAE